MIQPTLEQYREALDRLHALKDKRDQICMDNTPPWSDEVLEQFDDLKYWIFQTENRLQRMRQFDREQQWHGG